MQFSPKINCFVGNNGEGKTNLLDAVYYLSFCKSHTNALDSQSVKHDEEFFMLDGTYEMNGLQTSIYCGVKRRQKKQFKKDKKEYERLSEHIGLLPLVLVSPSDQDLILGGSEERRKFIDGFISQYDKQYLNHLLSYNTLLKQRNAMIKQEVRDGLFYEAIEGQMAQHGTYIFEQRTDFIQRFLPHFQEFHQFVSMGKEAVELVYTSQMQENNDLETLLKLSREKDFIVGCTTKGVHKDDLEMKMSDLPIKKVGSQGQNKTYLIALKLAQFDFLKRLKNVRPILLFDDIFDKLDALRVNQLIQLIKDNRFGQVFISDTDREHISSILESADCDYHLYHVEAGEISEVVK